MPLDQIHMLQDNGLHNTDQVKWAMYRIWGRDRQLQ